jgi:hypothetical protein
MIYNDTVRKIFEAKKVQTTSIRMVLQLIERRFYFYNS